MALKVVQCIAGILRKKICRMGKTEATGKGAPVAIHNAEVVTSCKYYN